MKHYSIALIGATVLSACLYSCNTQRKVTANVADTVQNETPATAAPTHTAIHSILDGEWIAYQVNGEMVEGADRPYFIFESESNKAGEKNIVKMYGNDGCNIVNGTFSVTTTGLMIPNSDMISTMRLCPDAKYEMGIISALNNVARYEVNQLGEDYLLNMNAENDSTLMTLRKYDLSFINGAWTVSAINGKNVKTESKLQLIIDIPELKIHGSVGCNTMNGKIIANPDSQNAISFTDMITTRMSCPDLSTEQELILALDKTASVTPFNNGKGAQLKDKSGNSVITLTRIELR